MMSFKSWALENPKKTHGYKGIEKRIELIQKSILRQEEELEKLKNGQPPDWFGASKKDRFSIMPSIDFGSIANAMMYTKLHPELSADEVKVMVRQDKMLREAQEELERPEREQELLKHAIKNGTEWTTESLQRSQGDLAEQLKNLEDYTVDEMVFEWSYYDEWEGLDKCLQHRLGVFGIEIDSFSECEELFSLMQILRTKLNLRIDMRLLRWDWVTTVGDDKCKFTRKVDMHEYEKGWSAQSSFVYALLSYLDHRWDYLIETYLNAR